MDIKSPMDIRDLMDIRNLMDIKNLMDTPSRMDTRNHNIPTTPMNHMEGLQAQCSRLWKTKMIFLHLHPHTGAVHHQSHNTSLSLLLQATSRMSQLLLI